jgi:leucyl/phenylalanyl-tRNA--protein transferase
MHGAVRLTPELLMRAYSEGLFPMAERRDDPQLFWLSPEERGIIPLNAFHIPRRLARTVRNDHFTVKYDTAFRDVMLACAAPGPDRDDSWINAEIVSLYTALHAQGHAHSVECWRDGNLVGGLYGVELGAAFFGESMFSRERDASKVALVHLVARLIQGGFQLLDAQFMTEHLARFGAVTISREHYLVQLKQAIAKKAKFYCPEPSGRSGNFSLTPAFGDSGLTGAMDATGAETSPGRLVLQLITQTS